MNVRSYLCILGLGLILLKPAPSSAQVTFYVTADSDQAFVVEGDDINANSAVELTVNYDSQALSNPRVSLNQGSVVDVVDSAGTLVVRAVQGDDSTASLAFSISFDRREERQGVLFSVAGSITEPDGTVNSTRSLPGCSSPFLALNQEAETPADDEIGGLDDTAIIEKSHQSILQRFRDFRGKPGFKAFVSLFDRRLGEPLVQEPLVAISDGKMPVRIHISLEGTEEPPGVALSDATLLHLEREDEKGWVITALPTKGSWDVNLIVRVDQKILEFPLVVAPPAKVPKELDERDFLPELERFLLARAGAGCSENRAQLKILYEYVFTANYLAGSESTRAKVASGKLSQNSMSIQIKE